MENKSFGCKSDIYLDHFLVSVKEECVHPGLSAMLNEYHIYCIYTDFFSKAVDREHLPFHYSSKALKLCLMFYH